MEKELFGKFLEESILQRLKPEERALNVASTLEGLVNLLEKKKVKIDLEDLRAAWSRLSQARESDDDKIRSRRATCGELALVAVELLENEARAEFESDIAAWLSRADERADEDGRGREEAASIREQIAERKAEGQEPIKDGSLVIAADAWQTWIDTLNSEDPREAAMIETFNRELREMQEWMITTESIKKDYSFQKATNLVRVVNRRFEQTNFSIYNLRPGDKIRNRYGHPVIYEFLSYFEVGGDLGIRAWELGLLVKTSNGEEKSMYETEFHKLRREGVEESSKFQKEYENFRHVFFREYILRKPK